MATTRTSVVGPWKGQRDCHRTWAGGISIHVGLVDGLVVVVVDDDDDLVDGFVGSAALRVFFDFLAAAVAAAAAGNGPRHDAASHLPTYYDAVCHLPAYYDEVWTTRRR